MKTIKADDMYNKHRVMEFTICGYQNSCTGEFYYNKKKKRYEHIASGPRGGRYLVVWYDDRGY